MDSLGWHKSSYSDGQGGNCVKVAPWRKSSYSGGQGGSCVEVADAVNVIIVRDTTNRNAGVLAFTVDAWATFTASLKQ
jgi:Domain of unknown function (DUF397)